MATMTKDLQAALKKAGLDASEVAQVEVGGVTNQKRLDSMLARARKTPDTAKSVADQLSVSAGVANLILDHWPASIPTAAAQPAAATPAPATPASVNSGQAIRIVMGPDQMSLRELLVEIAGGNREVDFITAAENKLQGTRAVVTTSDGQILVDDTMECFQVIRQTKRGRDTWNSKTNGKCPVKTLSDALELRLKACPITGAELVNGENPSGYDWSPIGDDRRSLAAFARITSRIPSGQDVGQIIDELTRDKLRGPWANIEVAFESAKTDNPALVAQAQGELVYRGSRSGSSSSGGGYKDPLRTQHDSTRGQQW